MNRSTTLIIIVLLLLNAAVMGSRPRQGSSAHPSGVITGRVVDDDGRPMRGIDVKALAYGDENGKRRLLPIGLAVKTNDRGEFRLFWLDPGSYYVVVSLPQVPLDQYQGSPFSRIVRYIPSDPDASFVTTYFPGTPEIEKAQPIEVAGNDIDVHAISMTAFPTRLVRARLISPRLDETAGPNPIAAPSIMAVALRPLGDFPYTPSYILTMPQPGADGTFEFRTGLAPGSYGLSVGAPMSNDLYAGSGTLAVENADPDIIQIRLSKSMTAEGTVQFEEAPGMTRPAPASLSITYTSDAARALNIPAVSKIMANGKFTLEKILGEPYAIGIIGLPAGYYLAAVKVEDRDVSPTRVEFPAGDAAVHMTLIIRHTSSSQ